MRVSLVLGPNDNSLTATGVAGVRFESGSCTAADKAAGHTGCIADFVAVCSAYDAIAVNRTA